MNRSLRTNATLSKLCTVYIFWSKSCFSTYLINCWMLIDCFKLFRENVWYLLTSYKMSRTECMIKECILKGWISSWVKGWNLINFFEIFWRFSKMFLGNLIFVGSPMGKHKFFKSKSLMSFWHRASRFFRSQRKCTKV